MFPSACFGAWHRPRLKYSHAYVASSGAVALGARAGLDRCFRAVAILVRRRHVGLIIGAAEPYRLDVIDLPALTGTDPIPADMAFTGGRIEDRQRLASG